MGVPENVVYPKKPNGFADHYPVFKWLFHWEYTQHFQTNPYATILTQAFTQSEVSSVFISSSHSSASCRRFFPDGFWSIPWKPHVLPAGWSCNPRSRWATSEPQEMARSNGTRSWIAIGTRSLEVAIPYFWPII